MATVTDHFREHPGLVWLGTATILAAAFQLGGIASLGGGVGSTLFVLLAVGAAPFMIVGALGVALTSWAPLPVQVAVVAVLAIGAALVLDDPLRDFLSRFSKSTGAQS